jgi:hypothetical protein
MLFTQVKDLSAKLAKKGMTPSQIGVILRDQHGVTQVKAVNGASVLRILKGMVSHTLCSLRSQNYESPVSETITACPHHFHAYYYAAC